MWVIRKDYQLPGKLKEAKAVSYVITTTLQKTKQLVLGRLLVRQTALSE